MRLRGGGLSEQSKGRRGWRRAAVLVALAVASFTAGLATFVFPSNFLTRPVSNLVDSIELSLYDVHTHALPNRKPDPRIVIVAMDDETLERFLELERPYYPLPRDYHAHLVDELFNAGAKVIGFDVMFPLPRREKREDTEFARALSRHGNVVAAVTPDVSMKNGVELATFTPPAPTLREHLIPANIMVPGGGVRWISPYRIDDEHPEIRYPQFGFALVAAWRNDARRAVPTLRDTFHWGTHIDAPVADLVQSPNDSKQVLIRYAGPAGTFPVIPYWEVYSGDWSRNHPANFFHGKIVIVGRVSSMEDVQYTPRGAMAGVEMQANVAQMVLTHDYLHYADRPTCMAVGAAFLCVFLLVLLRYTFAPAALTALGIAVLWAAFVPRLLLVHEGIWIETIPPLATLGLMVAGSAVYEGLRLRGQFQRFMPSWVANKIMTGAAEDQAANSVERAVTVVFCDIRDFTMISELRPVESVELLRRFFEAGDRLARRFGTELDKYVGDEMMLYFFDQPRQASHPLRAVRWAEAMLDEVRIIESTQLAGDIGFRVGIGIATGTAREGFVGARGRVQSTVIGDVVNLASRLQNATKEVACPLLMNEAAYEQVVRYVDAEPLGSVSVRGKQEPVTIFTLRSAMAADTGAAPTAPED